MHMCKLACLHVHVEISLCVWVRAHMLKLACVCVLRSLCVQVELQCCHGFSLPSL